MGNSSDICSFCVYFSDGRQFQYFPVFYFLKWCTSPKYISCLFFFYSISDISYISYSFIPYLSRVVFQQAGSTCSEPKHEFFTWLALNSKTGSFGEFSVEFFFMCEVSRHDMNWHHLNKNGLLLCPLTAGQFLLSQRLSSMMQPHPSSNSHAPQFETKQSDCEIHIRRHVAKLAEFDSAIVWLIIDIDATWRPCSTLLWLFSTLHLQRVNRSTTVPP